MLKIIDRDESRKPLNRLKKLIFSTMPKIPTLTLLLLTLFYNQSLRVARKTVLAQEKLGYFKIPRQRKGIK